MNGWYQVQKHCLKCRFHVTIRIHLLTESYTISIVSDVKTVSRWWNHICHCTFVARCWSLSSRIQFFLLFQYGASTFDTWNVAHHSQFFYINQHIFCYILLDSEKWGNQQNPPSKNVLKSTSILWYYSHGRK